MAIDKILGNGDLDKVADSVFSAVNDSVSEIKAMQKRKAAENVQVVIQALKKIESDIKDKYDGVTTVIEKRVASIKDGKDGRNGADGKAGKDGRPGRDGAVGPRGADGLNGRDGKDGENGVSVTDAYIDFDGSLIIRLSSGQTLNVGEVVAPDIAEKIKVITNGGGTSQGVLDTLTSLQSQITALQSLGAVNYRGTWNASTNSPSIVSGTGIKGYYYVVSVAGSTSIDGQTLWGVGDWIIFNGTAWQKVDGGSTGDFTTLTVTGNVGIGTSAPAYNLDVRASVAVTSITSSSTTAGNQPTLRFQHSGNNTYQIKGGSTLQFLSDDGSNERMRLDTAGNLLIGYTTDQSSGKLQVNGAGRIGAIDFNTDDLTYVGGNTFTVGTVFGLPLAFKTSATERMRITSTGNVGIGTSSPTNSLSVAGNADISGRMGIAGRPVQADELVSIGGTPASGTTQTALNGAVTITSAATSKARALVGTVTLPNAVFTCTNVISVEAQNASKGASATITNQHGLYINDQTQGTNNFGITSLVSSGANKFNIYASGTADNYFAGNLGLGLSPGAYGDTPKLLIVGGASSTSPSIEVSQNGLGVAYHWQMRNGNGIVGWMGSDNTSFVFGTGTSTERMRLDAAGNLGIGTTTPNSYSKIHIAGGGSGAIGTMRFSDQGLTNYWDIGRDNGISGAFTFTLNGSQKSQFDNAGNLQVLTGSIVVYAPAPAAITTTATLTNANIQAQLINTTGTTYTVTMPLGTTLETLVTWAAVNTAYDFTVINTASGTITMAANTGVTTLGALTIPTATSAQFRIRRTAANTFIMYRL